MANGNGGTALVQRDAESVPAVSAFDGNREALDTVVRMAKGLADSTLIPEVYRGNVSNVMVAIEYAKRLGASVLAVMQNLAVVKGKPSLAATFLIGTVNATNRFSPLRWRWVDKAGNVIESSRDAHGCYAIATDRETGEPCPGPTITWDIVKAEGWYSRKDKNGRETSKWQTIPELMFMYRSAAWWTRLYCPEYALGLHTSDEVEDFYTRVEQPRARAIDLARELDAGDEPGSVQTLTSAAVPEPPADEETEQQKTQQMRAALEAAIERHRPALLEDPEALHDFLLNATGNGDVETLDRSDMLAAIKALEKPAEKPKAATKPAPAPEPAGDSLFED
jgi:hypothetical protein